MEKFGTLDSSEKTIAILGDRWWPKTAEEDGEKISQKFRFVKCGGKKRNERLLVGGVPIIGVGTVLRLERDAWSMAQLPIVRQNNK